METFLQMLPVKNTSFSTTTSNNKTTESDLQFKRLGKNSQIALKRYSTCRGWVEEVTASLLECRQYNKACHLCHATDLLVFQNRFCYTEIHRCLPLTSMRFLHHLKTKMDSRWTSIGLLYFHYTLG